MNTKKVIAIGLLTSAVITLVAFGIKTKTLTKVTTPVANKQKTAEVRAESQTLTDLTNTKWYFKETLSNYSPDNHLMTTREDYNERYNIKATTYNITITQIQFQCREWLELENKINSRIENQTYSLELYTYTGTTTGWADPNYRTITFTEGTDTTNTKLINWLFENATLVTIETLENTSWQLNYQITNIPTIQYNINFYCNGLNFNALKLGYQLSSQLNNSITYGATTQRCYYINGSWTYYTPYSKILITNGNDINNFDLIIWLLNNAKQFTYFNSVLNTKWTFIDNPKSEFENLTFDVQFTSNKKPCQTIKAGYTTNNIQNQMAYGYKTNDTSPYTMNTIYNGLQWTDTDYKTIIIISGNDVENLSFISFLISNAEGTRYTPIPTINADDFDIENGNFVSLQSLMIQILTMPFSFISQAFNVTLWPNTAWEFNLSNFILALIAIATIMFIIKLFTSGFSVIGRYTQSRDNREFKRSQTKLNNAKTKQINENKPKVTHTYIHKDK